MCNLTHSYSIATKHFHSPLSFYEQPTTDMPTSQPIPDGMGYCSHDPAIQCMTVNDCNGCQVVRRRLQEEEGHIFSKDTVRDLQSCASTDGANCKKQNDCCTGLECFNYGGGRKKCRTIVVSTGGVRVPDLFYFSKINQLARKAVTL